MDVFLSESWSMPHSHELPLKKTCFLWKNTPLQNDGSWTKYIYHAGRCWGVTCTDKNNLYCSTHWIICWDSPVLVPVNNSCLGYVETFPCMISGLTDPSTICCAKLPHRKRACWRTWISGSTSFGFCHNWASQLTDGNVSPSWSQWVLVQGTRTSNGIIWTARNDTFIGKTSTWNDMNGFQITMM